MYQRIAVICFALLFVLGAAAQAQTPPLRIVTTTTQITDAVKILTSGLPENTVEITALMGAGVDPHLYQPTESDIRAMNSADAVFYSGLHLEGQFDTVFAALGEQGVLIYPVSQPVKDAGYIFGGFNLSEELTNVDDPHFWFDPRNWQLAVDGMVAVLAKLDPANTGLYEANGTAYNQQLDTIFKWAFEAMSGVPEGQRVLVTSHDAFQYFGDAFGWQVRGLQGISTEDEAGVADIQSIASFVIDNGIPVMFVESSVPPNAIQAVREAVNAGGGSVNIGIRELFSDAMGEADSFGGTYIGMIAQNVYTVLQSYQQAGVALEIPAWPEGLEPVPPADLLAAA